MRLNVLWKQKQGKKPAKAESSSEESSEESEEEKPKATPAKANGKVLCILLVCPVIDANELSAGEGRVFE